MTKTNTIRILVKLGIIGQNQVNCMKMTNFLKLYPIQVISMQIQSSHSNKSRQTIKAFYLKFKIISLITRIINIFKDALLYSIVVDFQAPQLSTLFQAVQIIYFIVRQNQMIQFNTLVQAIDASYLKKENVALN